MPQISMIVKHAMDCGVVDLKDGCDGLGHHSTELVLTLARSCIHCSFWCVIIPADVAHMLTNKCVGKLGCCCSFVWGSHDCMI